MSNPSSHPVDLVAELLSLPGILSERREQPFHDGLGEAIAAHDTAIIYRALIDGFSLQGISDANANAFIAKHGNADWDRLQGDLTGAAAICDKLMDLEAYRGCRFRKSGPSCSNPTALPGCPVPRLPLRKGLLNEQAVSLYFFVRDRCHGDIVGFIEGVLAEGKHFLDPVTAQRELLLSEFGRIVGVSRKLASMMLATLLMAVDDWRTDWLAVGRSMVVVDSLVHNFLHRTGILAEYDASHRYGPLCYRPTGCETILRDIVKRLSKRDCRNWTPRSVQHAIWRFCAAGELAVCNGNNIDDSAPCRLGWCPLRERCRHLPLRPVRAGGR